MRIREADSAEQRRHIRGAVASRGTVSTEHWADFAEQRRHLMLAASHTRASDSRHSPTRCLHHHHHRHHHCINHDKSSWSSCISSTLLIESSSSSRALTAPTSPQTRVAEVSSLSSKAKMAMKRIFTIFATNGSFLRINRKYANSTQYDMQYIVRFLLKNHCFWPKKAFFAQKIPKSATK